MHESFGLFLDNICHKQGKRIHLNLRVRQNKISRSQNREPARKQNISETMKNCKIMAELRNKIYNNTIKLKTQMKTVQNLLKKVIYNKLQEF